jgi:type IV secretory pathway VirB10-like protein
MSVQSRAGILPKALVAALVGTVAGGTAGVWSLRGRAASVNGTAPVFTNSSGATPSATTSTTGAAYPSPSTSLPTPPAAAPQPNQTPTHAAELPAADDAQVLERARALARRPDVTALMALRDEVVRRAMERGVASSSSVTTELNELDRRLNEARTLRLKLDAEEFRKTN